jgi:hypothetical protein
MYVLGADVLLGHKCVEYFVYFFAFVISMRNMCIFSICIGAFVYVLYTHMYEEIQTRI